MGIDLLDLPETEIPPEEFSEEVPLRAWSRDFTKFCIQESERGAPWLMTEAGYDLTWYSGIFQTKVHRQLINTWHLNRGHEYGAFDYEYTADVLRRVIDILHDAWPTVLDLVPHLSNSQRQFEEVKKELAFLWEERRESRQLSDS